MSTGITPTSAKHCHCTPCKHRREVAARFKCALCGGLPLGFFMVRDEVWAEAGMQKKDLACLDCFAKKLGRQIQLEDFTQHSREVMFGYNLAMRDHVDGKITEEAAKDLAAKWDMAFPRPQSNHRNLDSVGKETPGSQPESGQRGTDHAD